MKHINLSLCSGELYFPITQALPTEQTRSFFKRVWNFSTYKRKFKVKYDYCLYVPSLAKWIFIPAYFIFDGASVPKILNWLYNPTGMLLLGATPHDFGYRYEGLIHVNHRGQLEFVSYTKKELDKIFGSLCAYESGMPLASGVATKTLSLVGFIGWKKNRKKNCVLEKDFPELFCPEDGYNE